MVALQQEIFERCITKRNSSLPSFFHTYHTSIRDHFLLRLSMPTNSSQSGHQIAFAAPMAPPLPAPLWCVRGLLSPRASSIKPILTELCRNDILQTTTKHASRCVSQQREPLGSLSLFPLPNASPRQLLTLGRGSGRVRTPWPTRSATLSTEQAGRLHARRTWVLRVAISIQPFQTW